MNKTVITDDVAATKIVEALDSVAADDPTLNNWQTIKRLVLNRLKWEYRTLFSLRDHVSKQPDCNELEHSMIKRWEKITGTKVLFIGKFVYTEDYCLENFDHNEYFKKILSREQDKKE